MHNTSGTFRVILEATYTDGVIFTGLIMSARISIHICCEYFENSKCKYRQKFFYSFDIKGQKHFRPKQILFTCCKACLYSEVNRHSFVELHKWFCADEAIDDRTACCARTSMIQHNAIRLYTVGVPTSIGRVD